MMEKRTDLVLDEPGAEQKDGRTVHSEHPAIERTPAYARTVMGLGVQTDPPPFMFQKKLKASMRWSWGGRGTMNYGGSWC